MNDPDRYRQSGLHISEVNLNIATIVLSADASTTLRNLTLFACTVDVFSEPDEILLQLIAFPDMQVKRDSHVMILLDQDPRKKTFEGRKNAENGVIFHGRSLGDIRSTKIFAILLGEELEDSKKYVLLDKMIGEYESDFAILTSPPLPSISKKITDRDEESNPFLFFSPYSNPSTDSGYFEALVYSCLSNAGKFKEIKGMWSWIHKTLYQFDINRIQSREAQIVNDFILNEKLLISKRKISRLLQGVREYQQLRMQHESVRQYMRGFRKNSVHEKCSKLQNVFQFAREDEIRFFLELIGEAPEGDASGKDVPR